MYGKKSCARCHDFKHNVYPIKDLKTGEIEYVCGKCLTPYEREGIDILIKNAYEKGKGL